MSAAVAVLLVVAGMIFGALAMGKRSQPASKARKKSSCGKRVTASKIIAIGVLFTDATATYAVLYLCYLSITRDCKRPRGTCWGIIIGSPPPRTPKAALHTMQFSGLRQTNQTLFDNRIGGNYEGFCSDFGPGNAGLHCGDVAADV